MALSNRRVAGCGQTEGIITGDWSRSMGSWRKVERRGHETEKKDEKRKKRSPTAIGVERSGIVNRGNAKETHAETEHRRPGRHGECRQGPEQFWSGARRTRVREPPK